jgi:hypothetical protein
MMPSLVREFLLRGVDEMSSKHTRWSVWDQHRHRVRQLLTAARGRLVDPAVPLRIKALSYVRLCCAAMRMAERRTPRARHRFRPRTSYLTLLAALTHRDPSWWTLCSITRQGHLVSTDPAIAALLLPLYTFAAQRLTGRAA